VRFLPTTEFTFEEHLVVSAAGTTLRATLQGRGVAPTLEVRGEQSEDGKTEKEVRGDTGRCSGDIAEI